MRIALFGGTFDPIHRAHVAMARAAAQAFALDRVVFAPTGRQPLKSELPVASYVDRMAMVELALASPEPGNGSGTGLAGCEMMVSGLDAPLPDGSPNYTVDVLEALARELPRSELWALAGADSFLSLRRWREPDRLLALAEWIVVSRPGAPLTEGLAGLGLSGAQRNRIHLLETMHEDISATELRRRLRAGEPCAAWLAPPVSDYIRRFGLYGAAATQR